MFVCKHFVSFVRVRHRMRFDALDGMSYMAPRIWHVLSGEGVVVSRSQMMIGYDLRERASDFATFYSM